MLVDLARMADAASSPRLAGLKPIAPHDVAPRYHQIKEAVWLRIQSGSWRAGDALPPEIELCAHFGVSRGTVRRAIDDLVAQGAVERRQGSGSYVARPKFSGSIFGSYQIYRTGAVPHDKDSRVLGCRRMRAPREISTLMRLPAQSQVYEVERVQFMDGEPITWLRSVIPAEFCLGLEKQDLSHEHFYSLLERNFRLSLLRAEEFIEPALPDRYIARHLKVTRGTPLFMVERHSYTVKDRMAEYRLAYMRGDRFRFKVDLR
jgi:GntR family transcriptional regulator